jgi:hypothetical protein
VELLKQNYASTRSIYEKLGQLRRGCVRRWKRRSGEMVIREYEPQLIEQEHYVRNNAEIRYTTAGLEVILKSIKKPRRT